MCELTVTADEILCGNRLNSKYMTSSFCYSDSGRVVNEKSQLFIWWYWQCSIWAISCLFNPLRPCSTYVSVNCVIIGSDNSLLHVQHQVITYYLNQWWLMLNWILGNKFQWKFGNHNMKIFQEIAFENVICKMPSIWFMSLPMCELPSAQWHHNKLEVTDTSHLGFDTAHSHNWGKSWFIFQAPIQYTKMTSYQNRSSHCGDEMIVRSSYDKMTLRSSHLHNGMTYSAKMTSLYWNGSHLNKISMEI